MGCAGSKAVPEPKSKSESYQTTPASGNRNSHSEEEVQNSVSKEKIVCGDCRSVDSSTPRSPHLSTNEKVSTSSSIKQATSSRPQSPGEQLCAKPLDFTPSIATQEEVVSNGKTISPPRFRGHPHGADVEELKEINAAEAELNLGYSMKSGKGNVSHSSSLDTSPIRRQRQTVGIPRPSNEFIPHLSPEKAAGLHQHFHTMSHEAKIMGLNTGSIPPTHNVPGLSPVKTDFPWRGGQVPMPGITVSPVSFGAPQGAGAILTPSHSPVHGRGRGGIPALVTPVDSSIVRPGIIGGSPTVMLAPVGRAPIMHPIPTGRGRGLQIVIPTLGMAPPMGMVGPMAPTKGGRPQPMLRDVFPTDSIAHPSARENSEDYSRRDDKTTDDDNDDDDDDDCIGLEGDEVGEWDLDDLSDEKLDSADISSTSPSNSHFVSSSSPPKMLAQLQQVHVGPRGSNGPSPISQGSPQNTSNRSPIRGITHVPVFPAGPGMAPGAAPGILFRPYPHAPTFGAEQVPCAGSPKEAFITQDPTTNSPTKRQSKSCRASDAEEVEEEGSSDGIEEIDIEGDVDDWLKTGSGKIAVVDETEEKPRKTSVGNGSPHRISNTSVNSAVSHVTTIPNSNHTSVGAPVINHHRGSIVIPTGSPPRHQVPSTSTNPSRGFPLMGAGIRPSVMPVHRNGPIQTFIDPNAPVLGNGMSNGTMIPTSTLIGAPVLPIPSTPHTVSVVVQAQVKEGQTVENSLIRDTKVVKKKRAELPQHNLPHPKPKFGDWLNSRTMINNYIILESLGAGSYAEVKLCKEKASGKLFAMKFINRDIMKHDKLGKQNKLDDIKREIAIMKKLNHPNVLRLYEVMDDPKMNKLFLVLEYMKHGDLLSHQKKKNPQNQLAIMNDSDLHCILLQILLGLAYLHEQKIVHGDIKPQNLLVGDQDVVKIADFGISQSLYGSKQKIADTAGTPAFMSPEMCSGQEYSGQGADIWAVGATIFMLKFGNPPFVAKNAMQIFEKIQNDPLIFPSSSLPDSNHGNHTTPTPPPLDPLLENLLIGMLTKDPLKRMTLLDVMMHPWVTKDEKVSNFHLGKNPAPQITVSKEENDHAIDPYKFATMVNVRIEMMKKLHQARKEFIQRYHEMQLKEDEEEGDTEDNEEDEEEEEEEEEEEKEEEKEEKKAGGTIGNKLSNTPSSGTPLMSQEETAYRSKMFARKKPDSMSQKTVMDVALVDKSHTSSLSSNEVNGDLSSSEEGIEDEDDEDAVTQSPQLLDELLLTTLSLPPLSKQHASTTQDVIHHVVTSTVHTSKDDHDTQSFYGENPFLQVTIAVSSLQGRRSTQEDRYVVLPQVCTTTEKATDQITFVGLYDGHGGDQCAKLLQQHLHNWLLFGKGRPSSSMNLDQSLMKKPMEKIPNCCHDLDHFLCEELMANGDNSGSTATFCVLVAQQGDSKATTGNRKFFKTLKLLLGHVGDSRMVYSGPMAHSPNVVQAQDLTYDHRPTLEAEKNRIISLGGRVVNNRVNGVMAITRAFGDLEFKGLVRSSSLSLPQNLFQPDEDKMPALLTANPDISIIDFEIMVPSSSSSSGIPNGFLILACDGLWDVMSSEEACSILRERLLLHGNQQLAAKELAQEGIRRYSNDNITVIILQLPPNVVLSDKTERIFK
jgi:[calcium/calmodulin-dependent protein kinase] kinase